MGATLRKANATELFKGIKVRTFNGEEVLLSDLWRERPVVLKVLARLGCAMCKQEALTLREMKPYLDKHNVAIAAVAFEELDLKGFLDGGYWGWDILLDPERKVYTAAGLKHISKWQFLRDCLSPSLYKLLATLLRRGLSNPVRGDPRQLGGTFVITTDGNFAYSFRASRLAMFPSAKEIYSIVGGDPDEIEEDSELQFHNDADLTSTILGPIWDNGVRPDHGSPFDPAWDSEWATGYEGRIKSPRPELGLNRKPGIRKPDSKLILDNQQPSSLYPNAQPRSSEDTPMDLNLMLQEVNGVRRRAGVHPLRLNAKLTAAAQKHSEHQARVGQMTHDGKNRSKPSERLEKEGYRWTFTGENIASNQPSVNQVMNTWINSPEHYQNMINPEFIEFGAGVSQQYWTQDFGSSSR
ncbi:hypothetical protein L0F63_001803 [Massospora cicadina]|nr:hypothetical protein L0F63_001803 [Massospora cicadina]